MFRHGRDDRILFFYESGYNQIEAFRGIRGEGHIQRVALANEPGDFRPGFIDLTARLHCCVVKRPAGITEMIDGVRYRLRDLRRLFQSCRAVVKIDQGLTLRGALLGPLPGWKAGNTFWQLFYKEGHKNA